ncbi:hypothetical protein LOK49_LG11G00890 [Camellia lanceoleosa]|uniref:Uncharacterized protein n=1 Tax=Camellia lanceoleosa TaxID=1840588 RepID=A0ACC0G5Z1_9ERIC|nr:hypothetical protein LOK49_LG11G00890 [Camellia lanceoleosa]
MSQVETNVSLLSEENNNIKVGRNNLESAMKQLKEEADSQASKLADANSTIKSLEEALLKAENNISELVGEKKSAEEEISALNSKVNVCMEELAGTNRSLESWSLELSNHVNNLQLLLKDETLVSLLRRSFETKFESLKDMDLLLEDIKDHFVKMESETQQSYPVTEFENVRNVLVTAIEDSENKCTETRRNLENAIEERDLKQNKISKLESDLQSLQNSYQEMRFKLEDYQAKEDKLKDREAENFINFQRELRNHSDQPQE